MFLIIPRERVGWYGQLFASSQARDICLIHMRWGASAVVSQLSCTSAPLRCPMQKPVSLGAQLGMGPLAVCMYAISSSALRRQRRLQADPRLMQ